MTIDRALEIIGLLAPFAIALWPKAYYAFLRFREAPEITVETPANAMAAYMSYTLGSAFISFFLAIGMAYLAVYLLSRPDMFLRPIIVSESFLVSALMLYAGYCSLTAWQRGHDVFFPISLIEAQLAKRGIKKPRRRDDDERKR